MTDIGKQLYKNILLRFIYLHYNIYLNLSGNMLTACWSGPESAGEDRKSHLASGYAGFSAVVTARFLVLDESAVHYLPNHTQNVLSQQKKIRRGGCIFNIHARESQVLWNVFCVFVYIQWFSVKHIIKCISLLIKHLTSCLFHLLNCARSLLLHCLCYPFTAFLWMMLAPTLN